MFSGPRFCFELAAALLSAAICILTNIEPTWFEVLFDVAADGSDGSLEAAIAIGIFLTTTGCFGRRAWEEWGRRSSAPAGRSR